VITSLGLVISDLLLAIPCLWSVADLKSVTTDIWLFDEDKGETVKNNSGKGLYTVIKSDAK